MARKQALVGNVTQERAPTGIMKPPLSHRRPPHPSAPLPRGTIPETISNSQLRPTFSTLSIPLLVLPLHSPLGVGIPLPLPLPTPGFMFRGVHIGYRMH